MERKLRWLFLAFIVVPLLIFVTVVFLDDQKLDNQKAKKSGNIINAHEHLESSEYLPKYFAAAEAHGIGQTVLLGSPRATLRPGYSGYDGYDRNNEEILAIAKAYPNRFWAFVTLDPKDPNNLVKLQDYVARGAAGLKLYAGHAFYHDQPLDDPAILPIYYYAQNIQLPVMLHVNIEKYHTEFGKLAIQLQGVKLICPHFCTSSSDLARLDYLMTYYANLYTDISFGSLELVKEGFLRVSQNPEAFRNLILRYPNRIFFGADLVISGEEFKTSEWLKLMIQGYRDMLEKETYSFFGHPGMTLRGLALDEATLKKIYKTNFEEMIKKRPAIPAPPREKK